MRFRRISHLANAIRNLGPAGTISYIRQRRKHLRLEHHQHFSLVAKTSGFPLHARAGSSDIDVFYQIFLMREYSPLDDLKDVKTIVDLGANVGYSSCYFLSQHTSAKVIAVEPDRANFELLVENLAPFKDRSQALNCAIHSSAATLAYELQPRSPGGEFSHRFSPKTKPDDNIMPTVEARSLSAIISSCGIKHIDILKVDIEGAETDLFSSPTALQWLPIVRTIAIELHGQAAEDAFFSAIAHTHPRIVHSHELVICSQ